MKKIILLTLLLSTSLSTFALDLDLNFGSFCNQLKNTFQIRSGILYKPNKQKPFSGENICAYSSNGQYYSQGMYKDGRMDGKWTFWYENGEKKEERNYKGDREIGRGGSVITRYSNDQKHTEINYKDNKQHGKTWTWFENGQKKSIESYKDGEFNGTNTVWYENGQIHEKAKYKVGELVGVYSKWYENGQLEVKANLKEDKLNGKLMYFDQNGRLIQDLIFKDDICISGDCDPQ